MKKRTGKVIVRMRRWRIHDRDHDFFVFFLLPFSALQTGFRIEKSLVSENRTHTSVKCADATKWDKKCADGKM